MKLVEAIEAIKGNEHSLLIYDELIAYLEKLPSGEIDLPLAEGEFLNSTAVESVLVVLQEHRIAIEKEADRIRGLDVVEPKKRSRAKSKPANKRTRKTTN
jgi:hypothetical protein